MFDVSSGAPLLVPLDVLLTDQTDSVQQNRDADLVMGVYPLRWQDVTHIFAAKILELSRIYSAKMGAMGAFYTNGSGWLTTIRAKEPRGPDNVRNSSPVHHVTLPIPARKIPTIIFSESLSNPFTAKPDGMQILSSTELPYYNRPRASSS